MSAKIAMLKRIEVLYGLVEEMHSAALQQAVASVREADEAIMAQRSELRNAAHGARLALAAGDREQWALSNTHRELGNRLKTKLELIRVERTAATDEAQRVYQASRIQSEQVASVVQKGEAAESLIADRRTQALTDDRFLSRHRWQQLRIEGV